MAATENSGVFDVGTFDNAQFDTIEQPSTVNVFSKENLSKTLNKNLTSTVNVFSSLGREITRDLSSFVTPIQSQIDAQKQILRNIQSFTTVFSEADFRIGKKVVSTLKTVSQNNRTISVFKNPVSTIKTVSQVKAIISLVNSSKIKLTSVTNPSIIFTRITSSFSKINSENVRVIPGFQLFLDISASKALSIKNKAKKIFNINNEVN